MNRLTKICAAMLLAMGLAMPLWAQDAAETDDLNPAVDTSEEMPAVNTSDIAPAATPQDGTRTLEDGRESRTVVTTSEVLTPTRSSSAESGTLTTTTITGNAELPRVLYIVPWQKADPGDLMGKPVNSLLDELLQPIDRDEFRRQLRYYDDLHVSEAGGDPQ